MKEGEWIAKRNLEMQAEEARNLADKARSEGNTSRATGHEQAAEKLQDKAHRIDKYPDSDNGDGFAEG